MGQCIPKENHGGGNHRIRVRRSIREIEHSFYNNIDPKPLENLMKAFHEIQHMEPTKLNSFFTLGGYHGEPFVGAGAIKESEWWGGYCNHGNVLFPTWHRIYVLKLEEALNAALRRDSDIHDPHLALPYWDETSSESLENGLPRSLTDETFTFKNGTTIKNPLRSYTFQVGVNDALDGNKEYDKFKGYETVRYPLSGLVGTPKARLESSEQKRKYPDHKENTKLLNRNVVAWLNGQDVEKVDGKETYVSISDQFKSCLAAPNYTIFSNKSSQDDYNKKAGKGIVVSLESPHNDVHLAVGGFDGTGLEAGLLTGANGDMGENNTAAFDPVFFFHHCNIDRMFWLWQLKNRATDQFDINKDDIGANSSTAQGPTVNFAPDALLTMNTPLQPFMIDEKSNQTIYTSWDAINIERQLGYTYSAGSFSSYKLPKSHEKKSKRGEEVRKLVVSGINRGIFSGSFIVYAYAMIGDEKKYIGRDSVLNRWNVEGCANCQLHMKVDSVFSLADFSLDEIKSADFQVQIVCRGNEIPSSLTYDINVLPPIE